MNYTFVTKNTSQRHVSPPYLFISPFKDMGREKVKSFLIQFQADVALGDAWKVSHV